MIPPFNKIIYSAALALLLILPPFLISIHNSAEDTLCNTRKRPGEALFYEKLDNNQVKCTLCPRYCIISNRDTGYCRVRKNRRGILYSQVYGRPSIVDTGPIEKAPLYHFLPGHIRLCIATTGCNMACKFCHNWQLSQASPGDIRRYDLSPHNVIKRAKRQNIKSISFTYNEPVVFYEYIYDISRLARKEGIHTSIISNGYINPGPLRKLLTVLDAVKIDLKAFNKDFYINITGTDGLETVKNTLKILKEEGTYFEIVNLIIPELNDSMTEIRTMCEWISKHLGNDIPIHFSRFSPSHKLSNVPLTPVQTLEKAAFIAEKAGLKYVYIGNVPGHRYNSTFCPDCEKKLIHRVHFSVLENNIENGKCPFCNHGITGIW